MKHIVLALLLLIPALGHAEDTMWRWKDASGQLHYSNVPSKVPDYATPLRGRVGVVGGDIAAPDQEMIEDEPQRIQREREERARKKVEASTVPASPCGRAPAACLASRLGLWQLPVDLNHPYWQGIDCCWNPGDVEAWLRVAADQLVLRTVGIAGN